MRKLRNARLKKSCDRPPMWMSLPEGEYRQRSGLRPFDYERHRPSMRATHSSLHGESENKRKAKFYTLTTAGRKQLKVERESWSRFSAVVGGVLDAVPEES